MKTKTHLVPPVLCRSSDAVYSVNLLMPSAKQISKLECKVNCDYRFVGRDILANSTSIQPLVDKCPTTEKNAHMRSSWVARRLKNIFLWSNKFKKYTITSRLAHLAGLSITFNSLCTILHQVIGK